VEVLVWLVAGMEQEQAAVAEDWDIKIIIQ
jgi:hypothetical protein